MNDIETRSRDEFVLFAGIELESVGIDNVQSLYQRGEFESQHLMAVRAAAKARRPVHPFSLADYKYLIPELRQYSINGNRAVFDSNKVQSTLNDKRRALAYVSLTERREVLRCREQ